MTQTPNASAPRIAVFLDRLKGSTALSGWLGLLLGIVFGYLAARPELLGAATDNWRVELAYRVGAMLITGLIIGFAMRLAMRDRHDALRLGVALIGIVLAIIMYEIIDSQPTLASVLDDFVHPKNSLRLLLMLSGGLGAGLSLRAWNGASFTVPSLPLTRAAQPVAATATPSQPTRQRRQQSAAPQAGREGHVARRPPGQERAVNRARQARRAAGNRTTPQRIEVQPRAAPIEAPKPTRARRKSKVKLKLGRNVTTVCPYCLEEVLPNDPRGRVVCRICGTPHHGDCWAISGKCQVPHM